MKTYPTSLGVIYQSSHQQQQQQQENREPHHAYHFGRIDFSCFIMEQHCELALPGRILLQNRLDAKQCKTQGDCDPHLRRGIGVAPRVYEIQSKQYPEYVATLQVRFGEDFFWIPYSK